MVKISNLGTMLIVFVALFVIKVNADIRYEDLFNRYEVWGNDVNWTVYVEMPGSIPYLDGSKVMYNFTGSTAYIHPHYLGYNDLISGGDMSNIDTIQYVFNISSCSAGNGNENWLMLRAQDTTNTTPNNPRVLFCGMGGAGLFWCDEGASNRVYLNWSENADNCVNGKEYNISIEGINWASGSGKLYINGVSYDQTMTFESGTEPDQVSFFIRDEGGTLQLNIDNFMLINRTAGGGAPAPSLTVNTDMVNGTIIDEDDPQTLRIGYNGTLSNQNTDIFNCSLNVNSQYGNQTIDEINLTNNWDFNFTFPTIDQQVFNFSVNCTSYELSDETTWYHYVVDNVDPDIFTSFTNSTLYNDTDTHSIYWNISDNNLFQWNLTYYNESNSTLSAFMLTNITTTIEHNTTSIELNNTWIGNVTIRIEGWDSHTRNKVRPIKINKGNNRVHIDDVITISNIVDSEFYLNYEDQEYEFTLYFENESDYQIFYIKGNHDFVYVDSEFKGHFVSVSLGRYFDFEGNNVDYVDVTNLGNNLYQIGVKLFKEDFEAEFKSVGDLNYNVVYYNLQVQDTPEDSTTNELLTSIDETLDDIEEVIDNMQFVFIYGIWLFFGYWLSQTRNYWLGLPFLLASAFASFYFWRIWEADALKQIIAMAFAGLTFGSFIMWLFVNVRKGK